MGVDYRIAVGRMQRENRSIQIAEDSVARFWYNPVQKELRYFERHEAVMAIFNSIMGLLMLAAFAHFIWIAIIRPRTHRVDFGDAGFHDEEMPNEKPQSPP